MEILGVKETSHLAILNYTRWIIQQNSDTDKKKQDPVRRITASTKNMLL